MANYTRIGPCLLVSELASDPLGTLHRAVLHDGPAFGRHVLVRTFSPELTAAGLGDRLAQANRVVSLLGRSRVFGADFRCEGGSNPHALWAHLPGRTLAEVLARASRDKQAIRSDQALAVVQGLAMGLLQMHTKGLAHGLVSPHSLWVTYEGAALLLDAPFAALAAGLLSRAPDLQAALAPYQQGPVTNPLQKDLQALGAVFYEVLTLQALPPASDVAAALAAVSLQGEPLPAGLQAFLGRLLLGEDPFLSVGAFRADLEQVLYADGQAPSAFSLALLLQSLFREEQDEGAAAERAERSGNYLIYTPEGESLRTGPIRVEPQAEVPKETPVRSNRRVLYLAGGVLGAGLLALAFVLSGRGRNDAAGQRPLDPAVQRQLAEYQALKTQIEQEKAALEAKARLEADKTIQLKKQLTESRSTEDKARIQKQLEEAALRRVEVERQQKLADERLEGQRVAAQKLAPEVRLPSAMTPATLEPAKSAPSAEIPAAPQPLGEGSTQPTQATGAPVTEPAALLKQVAPVYPPRALQRRREGSPDTLVRLKVFVGDQGQPLRVTVVEGAPGGLGFDEAAVEAAGKSTYTPAHRDGKAVRGWTSEIIYRFQMKR